MSLSIIIALLAIIAFFVWYFRNNEVQFSNSERKLTVDEKFAIKKKKKEDQLNALLDKINQKGIESLSAEEKFQLQELSE